MKQLKIDFRAGIPVYTQIVRQVQQQVEEGDLKPGDRLPTVRQMAADLRVNFNTIARAYRILDEAGLISTQQGRGTYLLETPAEELEHRIQARTLDELAETFTAEALQQGFSPDEISSGIRRALAAHMGRHQRKENEQ